MVKQLYDGIGISQATNRIHTRGENEANMLLGQPGRVQVSQFQDGLQPGALRPAQDCQALLQQVARIAGQQRQVGDDAQRSQVQVLLAICFAIELAVHGLRQQVGDAHTRQAAQRVTGWQHAGRNHGLGDGQRLAVLCLAAHGGR